MSRTYKDITRTALSKKLTPLQWDKMWIERRTYCWGKTGKERYSNLKENPNIEALPKKTSMVPQRKRRGCCWTCCC